MKLNIGNCSDIGNFRPNNEDAVFSDVYFTDNDVICIGVVCDGIGGLEKGEYASYTAIEIISKWFSDVDKTMSFEEFTKKFLEKIYKINEYICEQSKVCAVETGSTITAFLSKGDSYMIANVGDSRTYKINNDVEQLTTDDVTVSSSGRSMLSQCIGHNDRMYVNTIYGKIEYGDCFLLCSDGFYKKILFDRFIKKCKAINRFSDIRRILKKEIDYVKKSGEKDNISAVLIKCIK